MKHFWGPMHGELYSILSTGVYVWLQDTTLFSTQTGRVCWGWATALSQCVAYTTYYKYNSPETTPTTLLMGFQKVMLLPWDNNDTPSYYEHSRETTGFFPISPFQLFVACSAENWEWLSGKEDSLSFMHMASNEML